MRKFTIAIDNQFICVQGDAYWKQTQCNGWAIISEDKEWLKEMQQQIKTHFKGENVRIVPVPIYLSV